MYRTLFAAAATAACLAAGLSSADTLDFRPATAADLAIPMVGEAPVASARTLDAQARCGQTLPRVAYVDLAWDEPEGVVTRRIDISKFPEGFATGRFETTGALAGALGEGAVEAPEPGVNYYWRVLSGGEEGWTSSAVRRFRVPVCKADVLEPDQAAGFALNDDGGGA